MKLRCILFCGLFAAGAFAETNSFPKFPRWSPSVRVGSTYGFDGDVEGGGSYSVNRYYADVSLARVWDRRRVAAVSVGYGQEDYRFTDLSSDLWNNIDNYRVGAFVRWPLSKKWSVLSSLSLRSYVETGAAVEDGLEPVFLGGAGYIYSEQLYVGPGFIVVGQIEDDPLILPLLLIDWKITDRLTFGTGRGFAATAGPGLTLNYELSKHWEIGLAGRYESLRFRLAPDNAEPDGVGEDESIALFGMISYEWWRDTRIMGLVGYSFDGKMSVYDEGGRRINSFDSDPGIMLGIMCSLSF